MKDIYTKFIHKFFLFMLFNFSVQKPQLNVNQSILDLVWLWLQDDQWILIFIDK